MVLLFPPYFHILLLLVIGFAIQVTCHTVLYRVCVVSYSTYAKQCPERQCEIITKINPSSVSVCFDLLFVKICHLVHSALIVEVKDPSQAHFIINIIIIAITIITIIIIVVILIIIVLCCFPLNPEQCLGIILRFASYFVKRGG